MGRTKDTSGRGSEAVRPAVSFHPLLFAIHPILHLYLVNMREIPLPDILPELSFMAITGTVACLVLRRSPRQAAVVSLALFAFFNYTMLFNLSNAQLFERGLAPTRHFLAHRHFLPLLSLPIVFAALLFRRVRRFDGITGFLNVFALALVALQGIQILSDAPPAPAARGRTHAALAALPPGAPRPDIYLIVPDSYARADTLAEYGFDNRPFLDGLRRRGFLVAERARANYTFTMLCLASFLNFDHLDRLTESDRPDESNRLPLVRLIRENALFDFLKRSGYRIVTFASGSNFLSFKNADVHLKPLFNTGEFTDAVIRSTPVVFLLERLAVNYHIQARTLFAFANLPDAARLPSPKFVFAHIMCPHPPYVFDADGNRPTAPTEAARYIDQVRFTNRRLLEAVDGILANSPSPPAILILADHGVFPFGAGPHEPEKAVRQRLGILCAMLLPGGGADLAPTMTSANAVRTLLRACFGLDLPPLPERSFFADLEDPTPREAEPQAP